jgi:hypothetical protein
VPLDEFLPKYDFSEHHATSIETPPAAALAAARDLRPRELPLMLALIGLRRLPRRLLAALGRGGRDPGVSARPVLDQMLRQGFVLLADRSDEVVLGAVGRFWHLDGGLREVSAPEFATFDDPGHAKAVIDFRVEPAPGGCELSTETRIHLTDEAARRSFGRYWRVVHPGSALIRREWLRAIRRRAERG